MRHRRLFTKTNMKAFSKMEIKKQAWVSLVVGLMFIVFSIVAFVLLNNLLWVDDFIFILPSGCLCVGAVCFFYSIYLFCSSKSQTAQRKQYDNYLLYSNMDTIDTFDGSKFERFCKVLFEKYGYVVSLTKSSGDYGVDLILEKDGKKSVGQCKRYSKRVSVSAVQEIVAGKTFYSSSDAFIITNNFFTQPAINLARANGVELIDRTKLAELIVKIKYQSK